LSQTDRETDGRTDDLP